MAALGVKIFNEYLSKLILEAFLPEDYNALVLSDAPDLRLNINTGIEVTRAMIDGAGQASGIFEHIRDKEIGEINPKHLKTLKKIDYQVRTKNDIVVGYGPKDAMIITDAPLKLALSKKADKVLHYNMDTIDLFIFSPGDNWFEEDVIRDFMNWSIDNGGLLFRQILVFEYSYLYKFETSRKAFSQIVIDKNKYLQCIEMAKAYALTQAGRADISK